MMCPPVSGNIDDSSLVINAKGMDQTKGTTTKPIMTIFAPAAPTASSNPYGPPATLKKVMHASSKTTQIGGMMSLFFVNRAARGEISPTFIGSWKCLLDVTMVMSKSRRERYLCRRNSTLHARDGTPPRSRISEVPPKEDLFFAAERERESESERR